MAAESSGRAALLLLADGRLPAGGYAHSGGLEAAVASGRVADAGDLERFLVGRATTTGLVSAAFAAAACRAVRDRDPELVELLDEELDARTASPALRRVSRSLGRQLLRAMSSIHPHPAASLLPRMPHQAVAFGAAAAMLETTPADAARGILHETLMGPAMAVVKVMSMDPFRAHRALATLLPLLDDIADEAVSAAEGEPRDLPAVAAPLSDVLAEQHDIAEVRLFAS